MSISRIPTLIAKGHAASPASQQHRQRGGAQWSPGWKGGICGLREITMAGGPLPMSCQNSMAACHWPNATPHVRRLPTSCRGWF